MMLILFFLQDVYLEPFVVSNEFTVSPGQDKRLICDGGHGVIPLSVKIKRSDQFGKLILKFLPMIGDLKTCSQVL